MIEAQNVTRSVLFVARMTNSATNTANIDCREADYCTIEVCLDARINTSAVGPTISLLESDDTVVTNFATFNSSFERSAEAITADKVIVYHVDTKARKRYLRLSITSATATNDDLSVSALALLSRKEKLPAATTDMGTVVVIG